MVEIINERIGVEVRAGQDGTVWPAAFVWRGRRHPIESWGRTSCERQGERAVCYWLVQTAGFETWELCQDKETAQWVLTRRWVRDRQMV